MQQKGKKKTKDSIKQKDKKSKRTFKNEEKEQQRRSKQYIYRVKKKKKIKVVYKPQLISMLRRSKTCRE